MKFEVFRKIDGSLFNAMTELKSTPAYQKFYDLMLSLDDNAQKVVSYSISTLFVISPLFIVFLFFMSNYSLKSTVETKEAIVREINSLSDQKADITSLSRSVVSRTSITSRSDVETMIKKTLSQINIKLDNVSVTSFENLGTMDTLSKNEFGVRFQNFSTNDLSDFLFNLLENEKFKVVTIDIKKDKKKSVLGGTILFNQIGRK